MPAPVGGVLAVDDAEVDAELLAQPRQPLLDAPGARPSRRRRRRRGSATRLARASERGKRRLPGRPRSSTWLPASCVYARERLLLDAERSMHRADLRRAGRDRRADGQRGSARRLRDETTTDGVVGRLDVDRDAVRLAVEDVVADRDDGAVDRRVDVRAAAAPTSSAPVAGPCAAAELVVARPAARRRRRAGGRSREDALVRLAADRLERQRVPVGAVVAERRHRALRDRELDAQRALLATIIAAAAGRSGWPAAALRQRRLERRRRRAEGGDERGRRRSRAPTRPSDGHAPAAPREPAPSAVRTPRAPRGWRGEADHRRRTVATVARRVSNEPALGAGAPAERRPAVRWPRDAPGGAKILIPRWIQLVGLPLLLLFVWVVAGAVKHVVFLFLVALADRALLRPDRQGRSAASRRLPRGFAVAIVYLVTVARRHGCADRAPGPSSSTQSKTAANRFDDYFTKVDATDRPDRRRPRRRPAPALAEHARPQRSIHVQKRGHDLVEQIRDKDVGKYTNKLVNFLEGAAISVGQLLFDLVLILVVSIYMLLGHAEAGAGRSTGASRRSRARSRCSPRMEQRRRRLREGPVARLADHRHERRASGCGCWASPGSCRAPTTTRSCSAPGPAITRADPLSRARRSAPSRRCSTRSSCTRSRRSGCCSCSSSSTRSRGTSSSRT